jgi:hypothetical protein
MALGQELRVRLLVPRGDIALAAQTARLERAITTVRGPIRLVDPLGEAEVVVELADYRRDVTEDGEPIRMWVAEYVLVSPRRLDVQLPARAQPFQSMVVGEDGKEDARAVELLERALRQALGYELKDLRGERPTP